MKQKIDRREFIKHTGIIGAGALAISPLSAFANTTAKKLVILHTNDVHSQIEPFPADHSKWPNLGGFARRSSLIQSIRAQEENVLLLDAGDYFQGTPYFNFFKGEVEVKLMNKLGYQVATIGNHEFDNGADALYDALKNAEFDIISANYEFEEERWQKLVSPYKIYQYGELKIGVLGLGIDPKGMIDPNNFKGIQFKDPLPVMNEVAQNLKQQQGCNLVIALTHLGYYHDEDLAENSQYVDVILGGHSHTFLEEPTRIKNKAGKDVLINQVGKSGVYLGRIEIYFGEDGATLDAAGVNSLV